MVNFPHGHPARRLGVSAPEYPLSRAGYRLNCCTVCGYGNDFAAPYAGNKTLQVNASRGLGMVYPEDFLSFPAKTVNLRGPLV